MSFDFSYALLELQKLDPEIVYIEEALTNQTNAEWLVLVRYRDGSQGAIEGDGPKILRLTCSVREEMARLESPEEIFDTLISPREA